MGCRLKENPKGLFIAFFEVAAPVDKKSAPQIESKFPEDFVDIGVTKELPKFCFPCDLSRYNPAGQHFTFVLTGLDNKQRFGFCRHPPGAKTCLCILSYLPWFEIFYKILNQIAELKHHDNNEAADQLIVKLLEAEVPSALKQFQISIAGNVPVEMKFTGPDSKALPRIPENRNMVEYFSAVNPLNMMTLFASLLNERRVLVTSEKLSRLAAIVHGAASLLYPLYWQHIYIPVMPAHLIDYCCAPMPFFVGVHSSFMPQVRKMALDEVVILNADTNKIETPFDDLQAFPSEAVSELKKNLKNENLFYGDGVARSFLKTLVYLLGGYREAVCIKTGTEIGFDQEVFVQCRSRNMQPFLEKLLQLQHFTQFIDARVDLIRSGKPINDLFEEELEIAKQDGSLSSKNLKETLRMHLISARTDGKKMLKDAQKKVQQRANPAAMKQKLKETRDFANKQISGMKTKLIKGKETEDIDLQSKANHRHTTYLDISLPLPASSAPTSPSVSPNQSPLSIRSLDVRRKTTIVKSTEGSLSCRPMTMAGIPSAVKSIPNRHLSDDARPSLPPKARSYQSLDPSSIEASTQEEGPPSDMNLLEDLQEVLQSISAGQISSAKERKLSTDETPVPMPRRKKVLRPLIPPPPIPPRRERRTGHAPNETLIDIANENRAETQSPADGSTALQNPLGVDCEDNTLAFQSVHVNNNAHGMSYMQEELPRNMSATTLLSDYGLNFGVPPSVDQERASSSTHHLCVPGLRATTSSPNLESYSAGRNPNQQVLVEQPPASTLPDLLCPANTLPRQTMNLVPASSAQDRLPAKQTLGPYQVHSQIQHAAVMQPAASAGNPFQAAAGSKDPFADLVSIQRQGVTSPTWKK